MESPEPVDGTRSERPFLDVLLSLVTGSAGNPASELTDVVDAAGRLLGAAQARLLVVDYGLVSLQELGQHGPTGPRHPMEGTLPGRSFARSEIVVSGTDPTMVWVPLEESGDRHGVLELSYTEWTDDLRSLLDPVVRVLVLVLISKRRYTDVVLRGRRAQPLPLAAEMQWDLLPPLSYTTDEASVSGILEPAYAVGGDSFDFAFNPNVLEFTIVDAVGRGMAAVSISVLAISSLRNARREGTGLEAAYLETGKAIEDQFGQSNFVTAQVGSLNLATGELSWLNAGHPLPLLIRDGSYTGQLPCRPSRPMGLRGAVREIATEKLQPGDRVLFYTDGVTEARSPDGEQFGIDRLADFMVRASLDQVSPAETVRRLSASTLAHSSAGLSDDASMLLIEYHG
ncbi:MAG: serine/threonine-protein phosphatase [Actinomycetota bacterium]|nr:serine/threonine-protein phosphatase [Actinomycetota bacterium]